MKIKIPKSKPRNPLYDHPLLRKSATHQKSNKAKRKKEKQELNQEFDK